MIIHLEKLQSVNQQHLSCKVKKSLLTASVNGHSQLVFIDKLDQDQVVHGLKPVSFTEYFHSCSVLLKKLPRWI